MSELSQLLDVVAVALLLAVVALGVSALLRALGFGISAILQGLAALVQGVGSGIGAAGVALLGGTGSLAAGERRGLGSVTQGLSAPFGALGRGLRGTGRPAKRAGLGAAALGAVGLVGVGKLFSVMGRGSTKAWRSSAGTRQAMRSQTARAAQAGWGRMRSAAAASAAARAPIPLHMPDAQTAAEVAAALHAAGIPFEVDAITGAVLVTPDALGMAQELLGEMGFEMDDVGATGADNTFHMPDAQTAAEVTEVLDEAGIAYQMNGQQVVVDPAAVAAAQTVLHGAGMVAEPLATEPVVVEIEDEGGRWRPIDSGTKQAERAGVRWHS